jgi:tetratricopeptide (TPR) repeat protein
MPAPPPAENGTPAGVRWDDVVVRARAGLFLDVLQAGPPPQDPAGGERWRRQVRKGIDRLKATYAGNQTVQEMLVAMREWLLGRSDDYQEWLLPCLDYLFLSLAAHRGMAVCEPVVSLGFFDFSDFQSYFAPAKRPDPNEESPEALDESLRRRLEDLPAGSETERELKAIDILMHTGTPDLEYLYVDGQGFCERLSRKRARERALRLVDHCLDMAEYHRRLGFSLLVLGEFADAIVCFQRQQRHAPDDGVIDDNIAWCQMKLGWLDDALANAKRALARVPHRSDVHHDYAAILFGRGQLHEALDVTSPAFTTSPEPDIQLYYLHALLLDRADRAGEAVAAWHDYLRRAREQPGHGKAVARAVAALQARGRTYSLTQYPIRAIAERTIEGIGARVEEIRKLLQQHGVSFQQLGKLEEDLKASGWSDMNALENRCRQLFDESEKLLTGKSGYLGGPHWVETLLLKGVSIAPLQPIFDGWRQEAEKRRIPYCVLLRDGVKPLLQQLSTVMRM